MKKYLSLLTIVLLSVDFSYADNFKPGKKSDHKETLLEKQKDELISTILDMEWIVEAYSVKMSKRRWYTVEPNNNYIQVNNNNVSVQVNSKNGDNYSANHVVSLVGEVDHFEVEEYGKNNELIEINMHVRNSYFSFAEVTIHVNLNGNAIVDITSSTGDKITYRGMLDNKKA